VPTIGEGEMTEADYLADRALHELRAAILAFDVRVRSAHLAMADAYTERLREAKRGAVEVVRDQ
jgi:hypothetical protein